MLRDLALLRPHLGAHDDALTATLPRALNRAARDAESVPAARPLLADDLEHLAFAIERHGLGAPQLDELVRLVSTAAAIEAETGALITTRIVGALARLMRAYKVRRPRPEAAEGASETEVRRAHDAGKAILGVRELRRAAAYARATTHPRAAPLAAEISRIADRIEADGWSSGGGRSIDRLRELRALTSTAADVEDGDCRRPVAQGLWKAIGALERAPPSPKVSRPTLPKAVQHGVRDLCRAGSYAMAAGGYPNVLADKLFSVAHGITADGWEASGSRAAGLLRELAALSKDAVEAERRSELPIAKLLARGMEWLARAEP